MADGHWEMLQTNLQPTPDSEFIFLMLCTRASFSSSRKVHRTWIKLIPAWAQLMLLHPPPSPQKGFSPHMSLLLVPDPRPEIPRSQGLHWGPPAPQHCWQVLPAGPFGIPSPCLHYPFRAVDFGGTAERTCPTYTSHFPIEIILLLFDLDQGCSQPSETGSVNAPNYTLQWGFILPAPELDHEALYIYIYMCVCVVRICVCLQLWRCTKPPSAGRAHPGTAFHVIYIYQFLWDVAGGRCQNVSGLLWCTVGTWDLTCGKRGCAVLQDKDTRIMFSVISYPWISCFWESCLLV